MNHDNGTGLLYAEFIRPSYDEATLIRSEIEFIIQVNGKNIRKMIVFPGKLLNIVAGLGGCVALLYGSSDSLCSRSLPTL